MKKCSLVCICFCLVLTVSGCSGFNAFIDRINPSQNTETQNNDTDGTRVYMDETTGTLMDFDGSHLTVRSDDEQLYTFDVSQAALECEEGMISGDEVTVIYEGQLSDTDTSAVKALKVVDEYHKKVRLEERIAYGKVTGLTPNTISIEAKNKKTATYPITGTEQYYQNGIQKGTWVYIHFKGKFPPASEESPKALNAGHLKVLSVSDVEPLKVINPSGSSSETSTETEESKEKKLRASILNVNANVLQILPEGAEKEMALDISSLPCYFRGGITTGSYITLLYSGEFNGSNWDGMELVCLIGDNPSKIKSRDITHSFTGVIVGSTANTITLQTNDGAILTCFTEGAQNTSSENLAVGSSVRIIFNPANAKTSNIYQSLKITDI